MLWNSFLFCVLFFFSLKEFVVGIFENEILIIAATSWGWGWTCFLLSPQFSPIFNTDPDGLHWQERLLYLPLNELSCSVQRRRADRFGGQGVLQLFINFFFFFVFWGLQDFVWNVCYWSIVNTSPPTPTPFPSLGHMTGPANHSGAEEPRRHSNKPPPGQPMAAVAYSELRLIPPFLNYLHTKRGLAVSSKHLETIVSDKNCKQKKMWFIFLILNN